MGQHSIKCIGMAAMPQANKWQRAFIYIVWLCMTLPAP